MKYLSTLIILLWSIAAFAQDPTQIYPSPYKNGFMRAIIQVTDDSDTSYLYQHVDSSFLLSLGSTKYVDSIFRSTSHLNYVKDGDTILVSLIKVKTNEDPFDNPTANEGDIITSDFYGETYIHNGVEWKTLNYDNNPQNEGNITFDDFSGYRRASFRSNTNFFARKDIISDSTIQVFINSNKVNLRVDTNYIGTVYDISLKQNTLVSGTNIKTVNGNSLLGSGDVSISTVDSTNVLNSYGTIITESPANTFNVKVDTSLIGTVYDISLKQNTLVSGTNIKTINSNSLLGSGNITIDTSKWNIISGKITSKNSGGVVINKGGYPTDILELKNPNGGEYGAGIKFTDSYGSGYLFRNGAQGTYSLDGAGNAVTNKKLHVDGGVTIGGGYDGTAIDANSLKVEGSITVGTTSGTAVSNAALDSNGKIVSSTLASGTVTSVGLTTGSSGTDVNVIGSPITSSGTITLNLPSASASNRGLLTSADWTTFNNKIGGSLTSGYLPYASGSGTLSDSPLYRNGSTQISLGTTSNANLAGRLGLNIMSADPAFVIGKSTSQYWYHSLNGNNYEFYNPNFGAVALWQTDGKLKMIKYSGTGNRYLYASSTGEINVSLYDAMAGVGSTGYVPRFFNSTTIESTGLYSPAANSNMLGLGTTTPNTYLSGTVGLAIHDNLASLAFSTTSNGFYTLYRSSTSLNLYNNSFGELAEFQSSGRTIFKGRLRVNGLASGGAAPSISGSTRMVVSDANGDLSFKTEPVGAFTVAANGTAGSQVVTTDGTPVLNFNGGTKIKKNRKGDDFSF